MTDQHPSTSPNFDTMTAADFEHYLPDFFATSTNGKVSSDPKLQKFLSANPDCAALVRDLETIAETARSLFPVEMSEPSDQVWKDLEAKLQAEARSTPGEGKVG